ncbi:MAG: aspartate/glutamate racemase family protein [Synergistaceae bacterium]|jgi:allantoin racemase|nr:aspartate/glutamate racemase family protein [Synergistaceae bacterium]
MRILYIKPTNNSGENLKIKTYLETYKESGTQVEVRNAATGPKHLESPYYEAVAGPEILRMVREADREGFDGAIVGCFYDPCLYAAREIASRMVVTAPAESSMHLAAMLGRVFSIIIGHDKWRLVMDENVRKYGFAHKLASFRSVGLGVLEFHKDPEYTSRKMKEEIAKAIREDLAETVILGCTMQYGFFKEMQEEFEIPVIDSMLAAFKYAEMLANVRDKTGWQTSRVSSYKTPDLDEMRGWGL